MLEHLLDRSADVRQKSRLSLKQLVEHRKRYIDVVWNSLDEITGRSPSPYAESLIRAAALGVHDAT